MKDSKNQRTLGKFAASRLSIYQSKRIKGGCCENDDIPPPPPKDKKKPTGS